MSGKYSYLDEERQMRAMKHALDVAQMEANRSVRQALDSTEMGSTKDHTKIQGTLPKNSWGDAMEHEWKTHEWKSFDVGVTITQKEVEGTTFWIVSGRGNDFACVSFLDAATLMAERLGEEALYELK